MKGAFRHGRILSATEVHAMRRHIDRLLQALVLIRLGQELGTDTQMARTIHDLVELFASLPSKFF